LKEKRTSVAVIDQYYSQVNNQAEVDRIKWATEQQRLMAQLDRLWKGQVPQSEKAFVRKVGSHPEQLENLVRYRDMLVDFNRLDG